MKTKYDAYNSWVSFFIVTCETLITGGLFYLLFLTTEDTPCTIGKSKREIQKIKM